MTIIVIRIVLWLVLACVVMLVFIAKRPSQTRSQPGARWLLLWPAAVVVATFVYFHYAAPHFAAQSEKRRLALAVAQRQADDQHRKDEALRIAEHKRVEALRIAEHQRVAREIAGIWSGSFHVERAFLNITKNGNAIRAVLLVGLAQAIYQGELADRNQHGLLLTPVSQTGDTRGSGMFHRTIFVVPSSDGTMLEGQTDDHDIYCCQIKMRRVTEIDGTSGTALTELFNERSARETEFVPDENLRLYNEPGDYTWDTLSLTEVKTEQLHLFDTGLAVNAHSYEYHHVVVRGPNYEERKAWIRWKRL